MPICIYVEDTKEKVAYFCDGNWVLIEQFNEFEDWVNYNSRLLDPSRSYIADIGFSGNYNAMTGGPAFHIELMKLLISANLNVHISEYPPLEINEKSAQQGDAPETGSSE